MKQVTNMSQQNELLNTVNIISQPVIPTKSKLFKSSSDFSLYIEKKALEEKIPYYQCLLEYCEENDLEPDEIAKYIAQSLKDKIEVEFAEMGLLKKKVSLEDYD